MMNNTTRKDIIEIAGKYYIKTGKDSAKNIATNTEVCTKSTKTSLVIMERDILKLKNKGVPFILSGIDVTSLV